MYFIIEDNKIKPTFEGLAALKESGMSFEDFVKKIDSDNLSPSGRFPANVILSHHEDCELIGKKKVKSSTLLTSHKLSESENVAMSGKNYKRNPRQNYAPNGLEEVENWNCVDGCPVKLLDEQSGNVGGGKHKYNDNKMPNRSLFGNKLESKKGDITGHGDKGGASRFFYCAKASKKERGEGNKHPTVKPIKLMQYLVRLVTPLNGIVIDPFMGSGTTGLACKELGFDFIGIEKEKSAFKIAKKRNWSFRALKGKGGTDD